jgi:hypothetical protein
MLCSVWAWADRELAFLFVRYIGGDKIPEFWGKPSAYTEGTDFLGTPKDHLEVGIVMGNGQTYMLERHLTPACRLCVLLQSLKKRPLSPDVLEIDGKSLHYKFPWGALSSITNRATGVALSVGGYLGWSTMTSLWLLQLCLNHLTRSHASLMLFNGLPTQVHLVQHG